MEVSTIPSHSTPIGKIHAYSFVLGPELGSHYTHVKFMSFIDLNWIHTLPLSQEFRCYSRHDSTYVNFDFPQHFSALNIKGPPGRGPLRKPVGKFSVALFSDISQRCWRRKGVGTKKSFLCQILKPHFLHLFKFFRCPIGRRGTHFWRIALAVLGGLLVANPFPPTPFRNL